MSDPHEQRSGRSSINLQVGGDLYYEHYEADITREDALQIFDDVAQNELAKYAEDAAQRARDRASELVVDFVNTVTAINPALLGAAQDPDFQWTLAEAKLSYARTGDATQRDTLLQLLGQRAANRDRSIRQISLNKAVEVVGELTAPEIAALAVIFVLRHTHHPTVATWADFEDYLRASIEPYADRLPSHPRLSLRHLAAVGCGTIDPAHYWDIDKVLPNLYPSAFRGTLSEDEYRALDCNEEALKSLFQKSDAGYQLREPSRSSIESQLRRHGVGDAELERVVNSVERQVTMGREDAREALRRLGPKLAGVLDLWQGSELQNFDISATGIAVAHAEHARTTGFQSDLSIWLPS